jgi:hypothetical protein
MAAKRVAHLKPNYPENPFNSPGLSIGSVEETESGNTSEQDEFHLERYSEGLRQQDEERKTPRHPTPTRQISNRSREPPSRKRPRPGLNIITDFSKPVGKTFANGVVIDQVKVQRPEVGQRPVLTARSHTVERVRATTRTHPTDGPGFVNLADLAGLRAQEKKLKSPQKAAKKPRLPGLFSKDRAHPDPEDSFAGRDSDVPFTSTRPLDTYQHRDDVPTNRHLPRTKQYQSPPDSSIVIGISVPENEVDSHKPRPEGGSALTLHTPLTPTIVVTPADAAAPWNQRSKVPDAAGHRRRASSVYSQATPHITGLATSTDNPPMPSLPHGFTKTGNLPNFPPRSVDSWETDAARRPRPYSAATIFDEDEAEVTTRPGSSSSAESKKAILPSAVDTARPQSKGWWNLMMSPMLSRAGTLMSRKSPLTKHPAPPIPTFSAVRENADYVGELDEKSAPAIEPEKDQQEAGWNIKRASTWSQWSNWEKERDQAKEPEKAAELVEADSSRGHKVQDSAATVQFMMEPNPVGQGLAAEYYHACAVDLRSNTPYFECHNHSCAEGLPKLVSTSINAKAGKARDLANLFDDRSIAQPPMSSNSQAASDKHLRSDSESTIIDDEPTEISPVIRKAEVAKPQKVATPELANTSTQSKAAEPSAEANKSVTPPEYSPRRPGITRLPRHISTVASEGRLPPASPGPISPEMQRAMASQGAIPMAEVQQAPPPAPSGPTFINNYTIYPELPSRPNGAPVSLADIDRLPKARENAEAKRRNLEKEDAVARKVGGLWRGRGCMPKNGCLGRGGPEGRKRRRWYLVIVIGLVLMVITSVVLATQLTRKGDKTPVQSQWLNLTGFPPMPTGISTIARPDAAIENSGCVNLDTLWSCAVPKEDQASIAPNDPDQPNFRIEIRFRNGTVPVNETLPLPSSTASRRSIDTMQKRQNDPFTNALFAPTPAPPATAEQIFLGNTTDNITFPFNGEATPFFITFIPTSPVLPSAFNATSSRLRIRQTSNSSNDVTSGVPPPDIGTDGTAAPANLLPDSPLPYSQPIHLYNRGQRTEHYGFYTYFDRAIFLTNTTADGQSGPLEDQNGGSTKQAANWRCTFSQTRFLVRIWTHADFGATLVNGGPTVFPNSQGNSATTITANSTATDFTAPGSFPYPVSITLDRHGGDMNKKGAYCYKMDPSGDGNIIIDDESPQVLVENRGAGGFQVNAAPSKLNLPGGGNAGGAFDPNAGGIDGGTGGCSCEWRNWLGNGASNA